MLQHIANLCCTHPRIYLVFLCYNLFFSFVVLTHAYFYVTTCFFFCCINPLTFVVLTHSLMLYSPTHLCCNILINKINKISKWSETDLGHIKLFSVLVPTFDVPKEQYFLRKIKTPNHSI